MADSSIDKKTQQINNMRVDKGKEYQVYQKAQNQLLQIQAAQRQTLANQRAISSAQANQMATMQQAAQLAAMSGGQGAYQQRVNPQTQAALSKYGMGKPRFQRQQYSNQQKQGQNVVIHNHTTTNTTNNVDARGAYGGPVQGRALAFKDNNIAFKTWISNAFAKQNEQSQIRERNYEKREAALTRDSNKMMRKLEGVGKTIGERMDPRRLTSGMGNQFKALMLMLGLKHLADNIESILDTIENLWSGFKFFIHKNFGIDLSNISGTANKGTLDANGQKLRSLIRRGVDKVNSSLIAAFGGDPEKGDTIGTILKRIIIGDEKNRDGLLWQLKEFLSIEMDDRARALGVMKSKFPKDKIAEIFSLGSKDWFKILPELLGWLGDTVAVGLGGSKALDRVVENEVTRDYINKASNKEDSDSSGRKTINEDAKVEKVTTRKIYKDHKGTIIANGEVVDGGKEKIKLTSEGEKLRYSISSTGELISPASEEGTYTSDDKTRFSNFLFSPGQYSNLVKAYNSEITEIDALDSNGKPIKQLQGSDGTILKDNEILKYLQKKRNIFGNDSYLSSLAERGAVYITKNANGNLVHKFDEGKLVNSNKFNGNIETISDGSSDLRGFDLGYLTNMNKTNKDEFYIHDLSFWQLSGNSLSNLTTATNAVTTEISISANNDPKKLAVLNKLLMNSINSLFTRIKNYITDEKLTFMVSPLLVGDIDFYSKIKPTKFNAYTVARVKSAKEYGKDNPKLEGAINGAITGFINEKIGLDSVVGGISSLIVGGGGAWALAAAGGAVLSGAGLGIAAFAAISYFGVSWLWGAKAGALFGYFSGDRPADYIGDILPDKILDLYFKKVRVNNRTSGNDSIIVSQGILGRVEYNGKVVHDTSRSSIKNNKYIVYTISREDWLKFLKDKYEITSDSDFKESMGQFENAINGSDYDYSVDPNSITNKAYQTSTDLQNITAQAHEARLNGVEESRKNRGESYTQNLHIHEKAANAARYAKLNAEYTANNKNKNVGNKSERVCAGAVVSFMEKNGMVEKGKYRNNNIWKKNGNGEAIGTTLSDDKNFETIQRGYIDDLRGMNGHETENDILPGDIISMYIKGEDGKAHQHIQIWNGKNWVSDHVQKYGIYPYNNVKGAKGIGKDGVAYEHFRYTGGEDVNDLSTSWTFEGSNGNSYNSSDSFLNMSFDEYVSSAKDKARAAKEYIARKARDLADVYKKRWEDQKKMRSDILLKDKSNEIYSNYDLYRANGGKLDFLDWQKGVYQATSLAPIEREISGKSGLLKYLEGNETNSSVSIIGSKRIGGNVEISSKSLEDSMFNAFQNFDKKEESEEVKAAKGNGAKLDAINAQFVNLATQLDSIHATIAKNKPISPSRNNSKPVSSKMQ